MRFDQPERHGRRDRHSSRRVILAFDLVSACSDSAVPQRSESDAPSYRDCILSVSDCREYRRRFVMALSLICNTI
jgi:hypothetical protein